MQGLSATQLQPTERNPGFGVYQARTEEAAIAKAPADPTKIQELDLDLMRREVRPGI